MAYLSMGEAHRRITEYLNRFSDAVSSQDGASLKPLLAVSSNSPHLLSLADSLNIFQVDWLNSLPSRFSIDFRVLGFFLTLYFFPTGRKQAHQAIRQILADRRCSPAPPSLPTELPNPTLRRCLHRLRKIFQVSHLSLSHLVLGLISFYLSVCGLSLVVFWLGWLQCVSSGIPQLGVGLGDGSCLRDRLWD